MAHSFTLGEKAFIIDNGRFVREVVILRITRNFCTIRYIDSSTIIRIRKSRLFANRKEAEQSIPLSARPKASHSSHWEYYFNH